MSPGTFGLDDSIGRGTTLQQGEREAATSVTGKTGMVLCGACARNLTAQNKSIHQVHQSLEGTYLELRVLCPPPHFSCILRVLRKVSTL